MKVLVCGSRDWTDADVICARLVELIDSQPLEEEPVMMHGAARGADTIAADAALALGFLVEPYPADWSRGKRAGPERNRRMLDERPDLVLAFQLNGSRGTQDTVDEARRRGIPVEVFTA